MQAISTAAKEVEIQLEMKGIITLCGSTKFRKQYEIVNRVLELNDWAVLTVASYYHCERSPKIRNWIRDNKKKLDRLHIEKIDISQAIVVIDVDGYVGQSTKSEIKHAKKSNKPVYYWSDNSWNQLVKEGKDID